MLTSTATANVNVEYVLRRSTLTAESPPVGSPYDYEVVNFCLGAESH